MKIKKIFKYFVITISTIFILILLHFDLIFKYNDKINNITYEDKQIKKLINLCITDFNEKNNKIKWSNLNKYEMKKEFLTYIEKIYLIKIKKFNE